MNDAASLPTGEPLVSSLMVRFRDAAFGERLLKELVPAEPPQGGRLRMRFQPGLVAIEYEGCAGDLCWLVLAMTQRFAGDHPDVQMRVQCSCSCDGSACVGERDITPLDSSVAGCVRALIEGGPA